MKLFILYNFHLKKFYDSSYFLFYFYKHNRIYKKGKKVFIVWGGMVIIFVSLINFFLELKLKGNIFFFCIYVQFIVIYFANSISTFYIELFFENVYE